MSQVKFKTVFQGKQAEVMAGWDAPIQAYHLTVFNMEDDSEEAEETLWSGLDHFPFPGMTSNFDDIRKVIDSLGIKVPEGFWTRAEKKEGNMFYTYIGDGQWHEYKIP